MTSPKLSNSARTQCHESTERFE